MGKTSKVLVFGQRECGKTSLLEQLIYGNFIPENEITPTIEDVYVANIESDRGIKEKLRFYDTSGLCSIAFEVTLAKLKIESNSHVIPILPTPEFANFSSCVTAEEPRAREVPRHYLSFADGIVLVYSINNQDSFTTIDYIKKDIDRNREKKELAIIVLANKKDLQAERQVDHAIALSWANREKVKVYEVTAKDRGTLIEPFVHLTSKLNPPPSKSTLSGLGRRNKGNSSEA